MSGAEDDSAPANTNALGRRRKESGMNRAVVAGLVGLLSGLVSGEVQASSLIDFEDVGAGLAAEDFVNDSFGFTSGEGTFNNTFDDSFGFDVWAGWTYSNVTDNSDPGDPSLYISRQYAAQPGGGADLLGDAVPGGTFAIGYFDTFTPFLPTIGFAAPTAVESVMLTNGAYPFLSMQNGDGFAKQFGGTDGTDPDFLEVTITGLDAFDQVTGSVVFALADFRFPGVNPADFILDTWEWVDLSGLGVVSALEFSLTGSDVGPFGLNTPAYVALDNLVVPEPSAALLLLAALVGLRRVRD